MKKYIYLISFTIFLVVLSSVTTQGWGPHTHNKISSEILEEGSSAIGNFCGETEENKQAFLFGVMAPDLTVIYYYEKGGEEYRLSHNWLFQQELTAQAVTDDEKCFAYGIAAHLIQDGISHTQSVPGAIEANRIPNWLTHPLLEKKYDSALILDNKWLKTSTPHMMDALDGPKADRYIEMIDKAMGENSQIDVKSELEKLRIALDEFYDTQFRPSGNIWIFKMYPFIDKLTNSLAPIIGNINYGSVEYYHKKAKDETINIFNNWGARYQISPHGFEELKLADDKTSSTLTWIVIVAFGIPIIIAWFKRNPIWVLLIPVLLAIIVVVVYARL